MQGTRGRMTRRELRQDEFVNRILAAWAYVEENYVRVLAIAGGVVVLFLIGVLVMHQMDAQAREAVEAEGRVRVLLLQGQVDDAILDAERIAEAYSGDAAAGRALQLAGGLYFETGRYAEAQAAFERYLQEFDGWGPARYSAWSGIAAAMEEQGDQAGAAAKYQAFADEFVDSPFAPNALREAARCYRVSGNTVQARMLLQRILDRYARSPVAQSAEEELKQMGGVG
ncbi:MAG: tetratricopeptide repeat protein [Candidatus Latescibacteria bacterium]|nr:tetratricopeptide repeat protein [Candidatus Latescibacterota bacterium]